MKRNETMTVIEKLAFFLLEKAGSVCGRWTGRMTAEEQRALFGSNLCGKRKITINGATETVMASKKVCFGTDWDEQTWTWKEVA